MDFNKTNSEQTFNTVYTGYHGTSGPMKIADLQLTPLVEAFLDAGRELSYEVLDVNGQTQLGNQSSMSSFKTCLISTSATVWFFSQMICLQSEF